MDKYQIKSDEKKKSSIYSDLNLIINIVGGTVLAGALTSFFYNINQYIKLFEEDIYEGILSVGLFFSTMIWIVLYIYSVKNELNLLHDYFSAKKIPRYQVNAGTLSAIVAVLFLGLAWFSYYIYIYCILVIFLQFFDIWGGSTINAYIFDEFTEEIQKIKKDKKKKIKLKILASYYLRNPIFLRNSINLLFFFFSFILVIYYRITNNVYLKYYAYIILILIIFLSNFILHMWRKKREEDLKE